MKSSWGGGAEVAMRKGHTAGRKWRVPAQLDPPQMHAHPSTVTEEEAIFTGALLSLRHLFPNPTGSGVCEAFSASVFF